MDLRKIFSGRVIGLIVFIFVVLFLGAAFNVKLEGMKEGAEPNNKKKVESMEDKKKVESMKDKKKVDPIVGNQNN